MSIPIRTVVSLMKHMATNRITSLQVGDIHLTMDPSGFAPARAVEPREKEDRKLPEPSLEELIDLDPRFSLHRAGISR